MLLAYIDPGSGSILIQVILASCIGGIAVFWSRIKALFTGKPSAKTPPTIPPSRNSPMTRVAGSFRDPSGYVFQHGDRTFRALTRRRRTCCARWNSRGHLARWAREGLVVGTRFNEDPPLLAELNAAHPGFSAFLEHDRIDPITYPYEWSTSMLADAGLVATSGSRASCFNSACLSRTPRHIISNLSGANPFSSI